MSQTWHAEARQWSWFAVLWLAVAVELRSVVAPAETWDRRRWSA
jgi:hypothetical protein